jgi:hypothetical protein
VLAKGSRPSAGPALLEAAFDRFGTDQLVALLAGVAVVAIVVLGRREAAWSFPAVIVAVAVPLHMVFAQIGWYERYQAYLVALGAYMVLCLLAELPATRPSTNGSAARAWVAPALVCLLALFSGNKPAAVLRAGDAMTDTYEQRYQLARFFEQHFEGEPIATGELGYVSLFHDGPITDVFGLGDYEVLEEWQRVDGRPKAPFWEDIMLRRGVDVVAVYPLTLFKVVPDSWIAVGSIGVDHPISTAPGAALDIYATRPEAVAGIKQALEEFRDDVPAGTEVIVNPLAEMRADAVMAGTAD